MGVSDHVAVATLDHFLEVERSTAACRKRLADGFGFDRKFAEDLKPNDEIYTYADPPWARVTKCKAGPDFYMEVETETAGKFELEIGKAVTVRPPDLEPF